MPFGAPAVHGDGVTVGQAPRSALDASGKRRQLELTRGLAITAVVLGLVILVVDLVGWKVLHRYYERKQDQLDAYPGEVIDLWWDGGDDGRVQVQYIGPGGPKTQVAVHDMSEWTWGRRVDVLVDPDDPSVITVRGENFLPEWYIDAIVTGLVVGGVLLLGGLGFGYQSHQRIQRKSRSPWVKAFGSAITVKTDNSKTTYAYFPAFAPDIVWSTSGRVPEGRLQVEIAGDQSGAVLRLPGGTREYLARPRPLESLGTIEVRAWTRFGSVIAMRVEDVVFVANDEEFADLAEEQPRPLLATVQRIEPKLGVVTLTGAYRSTMARRVSGRTARKAWPGLSERA